MSESVEGFEAFGFSPALSTALVDMGFVRPTPIQVRAIPLVLEGRDLIGCASTGTGKTAAFLLPTLQRLYDGARGKIRALILSPTRELAAQIDEQAMALSYHLDLASTAVVGGVDMSPQEHALRAGVEVVVATPGRLIDHLRYGYVDLSAVEVFVLDEADRMLDMGFLPDMKRIIAQLPATRQTLLFSATMAAPIRKLAEEILNNPVEVAVDPQRPAEGITHTVISVGHHRKAALLSQLLRRASMPSVVVFVKRKADANRVAATIERAGVTATSIHSDRTQQERFAALESFRKGESQVLVATDVAARGLDVDGITHVVNYDVPHASDDYIHRGGRTARAGARGNVITFVAPDEENQMGSIERGIGGALPRRKLPGFEPGLEGGPSRARMDRSDRSSRPAGGGRGRR